MRSPDKLLLFPMLECLRGLVVAIVVLLLVQTFLIEGLMTPYLVSSCSMSPTFRGPHVELRCPGCENIFRIETGHWPSISSDDVPFHWATCPACSFAQVPISRDSIRDGDRVFVNRAALSLQPLCRWDAVLFRTPADTMLTVKRIAGLPGEVLEIRNGDIYINGKIAAKPFDVQQAMRIPVPHGCWEMQPGTQLGQYELAFRPIRNVPHGNLASAIDAADVPKNDSTGHLTSDSASDWDADSAIVSASAFPSLYGVTNQLCENQWRAQSGDNIFPVGDLMIEFDWQPEASMPLMVRVANAATDKSFQVRFDADQKTLLVMASATAWRSKLPRVAGNEPQKITLSFFDQLMLVAINGEGVFAEPFDTNMAACSDDAKFFDEKIPPFAFFLSENTGLSQIEQADALKRQIANMRIWRDVYYTPKTDFAASVPTLVTIPKGCYYMLGDNSCFSIDSRNRNEPFIKQCDLIGTVSSPK